MIWPAQSPDLNPLEHLWVHLKRRLAEYEHPPKGMEELWRRIEEEWNKILAESQSAAATGGHFFNERPFERHGGGSGSLADFDLHAMWVTVSDSQKGSQSEKGQGEDGQPPPPWAAVLEGRKLVFPPLEHGGTKI
ncbi:uncharacterized protein BJ212DRAFT_1485742 [Suillus subaureus]|uniref:Tc1-like transposase DDE domain-containing protein n=1 Tax=Suillus subaureus TaxID=48587 RepID=A0A9P7E0A8_9AGAM|nr:uncharacterized protein BJ212DRAFT_1485742 [Suillus subaureus]KAG1807346.1 hypothetical protein BJ212DRAFT_1485742 [Suillus subaureus]